MKKLSTIYLSIAFLFQSCDSTPDNKSMDTIQQQFLLGKEFTFQSFNHQPAIRFWENDKLHNCHILQLNNDGLIQDIYSIVDPEKLTK
ncbi:hypothetical protein C5749_07890 [Sphingobacterium gobiense]|uniref:Uncharacterized protein n=1 Tax=Sphingobacterium gobiense TaxID=1382456 RepID=A0A2S9JV13_9SPHI|nr:hypothetical protein C5749_07890 [Sphingobacterium gobiense]